MLYVIAKITAKQEQILEVKKSLEKLKSEAVNEEGCHAYEVYEDIEQKNIFFTQEKWESKEFLNKHITRKTFSDFVEKSKTVLIKPIEVNFLSQV
jgi:quinol monooxygenase YgiN